MLKDLAELLSYLLIGEVLDGLIFCFLVSRLLLRLFRGLKPLLGRIALAHAATLGIATLIGGVVFAGGRPPRFGEASRRYVVPVVIIAMVDFVRLRRKTDVTPTRT